jgi:hypothetical protein
MQARDAVANEAQHERPVAAVTQVVSSKKVDDPHPRIEIRHGAEVTPGNAYSQDPRG